MRAIYKWAITITVAVSLVLLVLFFTGGTPYQPVEILKDGLINSLSWSDDGERILASFLANDSFKPELIEISASSLVAVQAEYQVESLDILSNPQFWSDSAIVYKLSTYDVDLRLGASSLYIVREGLSTTENILTFDLIDEFIWHQRNERLVYTALYSPNHYSVYLWDYPIEDPVQIFDPPQQHWVDDIALDSTGTKLLFVMREDRKSLDSLDTILMLELGTDVTRLIYQNSKDSLVSPTWSPNGKWIAYLRQPYQQYGDFEVVFIELDGERQIVVTSKELGFIPVEILWSPTSNQMLVKSLGVPGSQGLYMLDLSALVPGAPFLLPDG